MEGLMVLLVGITSACGLMALGLGIVLLSFPQEHTRQRGRLLTVPRTELPERQLVGESTRLRPRPKS
jgi:hypothetical protein